MQQIVRRTQGGVRRVWRRDFDPSRGGVYVLKLSIKVEYGFEAEAT
jgi:hypothetical protein